MDRQGLRYRDDCWASAAKERKNSLADAALRCQRTKPCTAAAVLPKNEATAAASINVPLRLETDSHTCKQRRNRSATGAGAAPYKSNTTTD